MLFWRSVVSLVLLMIMSSFQVWARTTPLTDYFRESLTTRDGLPHNTINAITQSNDGYLWFATWEGAARYDGRNFSLFGRTAETGLPDLGIRAFHLASNGDLLLGGSRGGMALVKDGRWQHLPAIGTLINDLLRDHQGDLWMATEGGGLFRLSKDGIRTQFTAKDGLRPSVIYRVLQDKEGLIWLATQQGLYWFDPKMPSPVFTLVATDVSLPLTSVFALAQTAAGELLVGTEQGAFKKDGSGFVPLHQQLAGIAVATLMLDQQQHLWIGTINRGVMRLSDLGLEQLTVSEGLPNNRVLAMWQDKELSIWIGTNGGVLRLRDTPFTNLTTSKGLADNYVRTLLQHQDGSVWVGTSNGLNKVVGQQIDPVPGLDGNPVSALSLAQGPDGDIWVGSYAEGVLRYRNNQIIEHYDRADGLVSNEVRALLPLADGSVWIGSSGGLTRLKDGQMHHYHVADGLPGEFITALHQSPDGRLWIGTGSGAAVYEQGKFLQLDLQQYEDVHYVFSFYQAANSADVWFATDRGLLRFDASNKVIKQLGMAQGLPFDKIFAIVAEQDQYFWLSSNRGVLRIRQQDAVAITNGTLPTLVNYELYGESDGMQSAQCNGGSMPAAAALNSGALWFATSQGVAMVEPSRLADFVVKTPPVVVQKISADGQIYAGSAAIFPPGTRRVALQFAGLSYVMPTRIQYRTQLLGFDQHWVERGPQQVAEYTNLAPGAYRFVVSAAYPDGDWSAEPAQFEFVIEPRLWQRTDFIVGVGLALLLLVVLVYRARMLSVRHNEMRLRQQVSEKTAALQQQATELRQVVTEKSALAEQLRQQAEAFALQAREDGLTGLANRRAFDEQLAAEFARAARLQQPLCLVLIDIDYFKRINDTYSHLTGDAVLKRLAGLIKAQCRDIDISARWGGEEFALLLPQTSLEQGREVCERLRHGLAQLEWQDVAPGLTVTASFGVAVNTGLLHYEKLISRADTLLYQAKAQGRDQVCG